MKRNVGRNDAAIRTIIGFVIMLLGYYYKSWWGLLSFVFFATAFYNTCLLYKLFGINTLKTDK